MPGGGEIWRGGIGIFPTVVETREICPGGGNISPCDGQIYPGGGKHKTQLKDINNI